MPQLISFIFKKTIVPSSTRLIIKKGEVLRKKDYSYSFGDYFHIIACLFVILFSYFRLYFPFYKPFPLPQRNLFGIQWRNH